MDGGLFRHTFTTLPPNCTRLWYTGPPFFVCLCVFVCVCVCVRVCVCAFWGESTTRSLTEGGVGRTEGVGGREWKFLPEPEFDPARPLEFETHVALPFMFPVIVFLLVPLIRPNTHSLPAGLVYYYQSFRIKYPVSCTLCSCPFSAGHVCRCSRARCDALLGYPVFFPLSDRRMC